MHEFELIKNYFQKLSKKSPSALNLNDDVFFDKKKSLAVSVDTYVEGNHFINFKKPELVIKKIIRSSISDLVCKGIKPKYYFISGSGNKKSFSKLNLSKISKSLNQEQNKYKIFLSGGDTVFSNKLSFTITSIGFANNIIYRNKAKINDDIYVSGNLGDSYLGLLVLKNKFKLKPKLKKYFTNQYFMPNIQLRLTDQIKKFANTSIDVSDGLLADLDKMINCQKLSYKLFLKDIPISSNLKKILDLKKLSKINYISNGDDYQVLFTASKNKMRIIKKIASNCRVRLTKIGSIQSYVEKSSIIDDKNRTIALKTKGYLHQF
ncbi:thiamine-phosphate kinase [Candidatus Pelagibacter ubique]|uniref:Thiamine-monophosphate kinase n=1 Tax=Pelagibacter ubique TaxID=198252 RepID=A0ABX1T1I9_PELUQ|nr:thiamine-phosphate kinase [Candidatus Pelagibacter ubique]NMN67973.1 thiamine-phosphate kinase [Candidatus Pelagibacter ubique]